MDLSNITVNEQSSIKIAGEKIVYFDPYNIQEESHDADIIFVTHEHGDHFQPESIGRVAKENTILVMPKSMEEQKKNIDFIVSMELLVPEETKEIGGIKVQAVPAYNKMKPFHPKNKKWLGYIIEMDGVSYYIAGDTDVNADIKRVSPDVAIIPIGGMFTMNRKQAADYIVELKPKACVPTHYGSIVGDKNDGIEFKKLVENEDDSIVVELRLS